MNTALLSSTARWHIRKPNSASETLPVLSRDIFPRTTAPPHQTDLSVIELNGRRTALRLFFSSTGIEFTRTQLFFPTRLVRPADPRGYLCVCLPPLPPLPSPPTTVEYDGCSISFSSSRHPFRLSLLVHPTESVIHVSLNTPSTPAPRCSPPSPSPLYTDATQAVHVLHNRPDNNTYDVAIIATDANSVHPMENLPTAADAVALRFSLVKSWSSALTFRCPEPALTFFHHFAKVRTAEATFDASRLGPVHSPGGGMFYVGVWCNDQAEYAAAALVHIAGASGDSFLQRAVLNSLKVLSDFFLEDVSCENKNEERTIPVVPYSVEIDGGYIGRLDCGDAAMWALGAAEVLLLRGTDDEASRSLLLPGLKRTTDLILRASEAHEVVPSQSDELEGRFPTGDANLATCCLSVRALELASEAFNACGDTNRALECGGGAKRLRRATHQHFEVTSEGSGVPYAYFVGCDKPRGWVSLAGTAGLPKKRKAVRAALGVEHGEISDNGLWSDKASGVRVEAGQDIVWDRETWYAIREGLRVGGDCVELALLRWKAVARQRLNGPGVGCPFSKETADGEAQLAGESALVVRIVTDGLLGLRATGEGFELWPVCPKGWNDGYDVGSLWLQGVLLDVSVRRSNAGGGSLEVTLRKRNSGKSVLASPKNDDPDQIAANVVESGGIAVKLIGKSIVGVRALATP